MNGIEAAQIIRSLINKHAAYREETKIIMCSAFQDERLKLMKETAVADFVVSKPISIIELSDIFPQRIIKKL